MAPEAVIRSALEFNATRLDSMRRAPPTWGGPEALELQSLLALEFRSMLGRPVAYAANRHEVRDIWIAFVCRKARRSYNSPLFTLYEGREKAFHKALAGFITLALERLPLEASDA